MFGFYNTLLRVDLTNQRATTEPISDEMLQVGLGGKGLATQLLLREVPTKVDPLSPQNPLIFAIGPIANTAMPGASRYGVYAKAPLTGAFGESYSGGHVAPVMKKAGYDAIILQGAAKSPVYLEISDQGVKFHSADHLWGKDTYEAEESMIKEVGVPKAQAVVIGPAGEKMVRYAVIENNKWRSAGRTGMGALMGSKKVKGIVFHGQKECQIADPAGLAKFAAELTKRGNADATVKNYRRLGTPMMVAVNNTNVSFP
ncbi:MAG TPA: aldehyde ferredoxin oxidoreductase N-terminal domain-containing protein, partial [Dehalococcoidia bacterium]|nr:aldehyde ferredoxin oxidoreductase N-terminal domain-containing protein [Dehalococcoidia bacterium]